jgi:hypothetical protein
MSKSAVLAAATAAMLGALSIATAPSAEAHRYRYHSDRVVVFYGHPPHVYDGYRPYYGPYYYREVGLYQRPAGIFRPGGVVFRPFDAAPSQIYCRRWGFTYTWHGRPKKWRCMAW